MNRIYRSIWNDRTGTFVAASENTKSCGKKSSPGASAVTRVARFALNGLAVSLMLAFGSNVYALPTGGAVSAGSASIAGSAGKTTINQSSQNVAINWQSFSIGQKEAVQFVQPNSSSIALNRVLGSDASSIFGGLSANGKVFLVNPNGILFGQGAQVNVGGLVASTLNITDGDFMAGRYNFAGTGKGTILNQGSINADGGYVALLGASVSNQGVISAKLGTVALAAGNAITLDVAGDGLLNVTVSQGAVNALVQNGGLIQADGGQVLLTAQAAGNLLQSVVNNTGVIQAQTVENHNGTIRLLADMQSGTVNISGTLDASGTGAGQTGGNITATGQHVGLFGGHISASGDAGGGTVLVGGDLHGANPAIQNASATYMSSDATISADAITNGSGGTVVLWSNDSTRAYGSITARGGAQGCDGGLIETSGHWLDVGGIKLSAGAPHGQNGTWLLDPADVTITGPATSNDTNTGGVFSPNPGANSSNIAVSDITTILSGVGPLGTNVTINTTNTGASGSGSGDITVGAAITWNGAASATGSTTLTLNAARDVNINAAITATSGNLVVCCGRDITVAAPLIGSQITTTNGSVLLSAGRDIFVNGATTTTDGNFAMCAGRDVNVGAAMTLTRGSVIATQSLASLGVLQGMTLSAGNAANGPGLAGGGGAVIIAPPGGTITVTQGGGPTTAAPVTIIYNPLSYATPATNFSGSFTAGTPITVKRLVFPTGPDKTFDGTTGTTLTALSGTPAGVTLVPGATPVANFDTAAVGAGKLITFSGYGLDAVGNLSFALPLPCCAPVIQRTTGNIIAVVEVIPVPPVVPIVPPVVIPPAVILPPAVVVPPVVVAPPEEVAPPVVVAPVVAPVALAVESPEVQQAIQETLNAPQLSPYNLTVVGVRMPLVQAAVPPPVYVPPPPVVVPPVVPPPVYVPPPLPPRRDRN
jgi:filamentous hemagglutinin family protein